MKHVLCKVLGHNFAPDCAEDYDIYYCKRCGEEEPQYTTCEKISWRLRAWFRDTCRSWRNWWYCKECKHHFGRHDSDVDHVPF